MSDVKVAIPVGRILVTGGNGFIGGHVIDALIDRGYDVTILDRYGMPHRRDVEYVLGDVSDGHLITSLADRHEGIINLAAVLGTSETVEFPRSTVETNLLGAVNVYQAARDKGVRVVQITVGNYWMNNPYAITKNASEKLALFYNKHYGTRITVIRGLNAYGERQKPKPVRKIMPNLVIPAIRETEIMLYGDGKQKMDMIYVGDLAEILVLGLTLDHGAYDRILDAGTGDAPTINQICKIVLDRTNSKVKVTHVPMRQGEPIQAVVRGDPETLRPLGIDAADLLGLEEGVDRTVAYYRENIDEF